MKRYVIAASILIAHTAMAESRSVEELNYQVSGTYGEARYDDTTYGSGSSSFGVNAKVTLPIATYFGTTISGGYAEYRVPFDFSSISGSNDDKGTFKPHGSNIGIDFFLRDFDIGKVGIGYVRGRSQSAGYSTYSKEIFYEYVNSDAVTVYGDYYFQSVTAFGRYTNSKTYYHDWDTYSYDTYSLGAKYYPLSNLAVDISIQRTPATNGGQAQDSQYLSMEYQPEFLGSSTSIFLGLGHQESSKSAMIGLTYFFDKRVDLITRDRRYR